MDNWEMVIMIAEQIAAAAREAQARSAACPMTVSIHQMVDIRAAVRDAGSEEEEEE